LITIEAIKETSGVHLTDSGERGKGPWNISPEYPLAVEQASAPLITRVSAAKVRLSWTPESGMAACAHLWLDVLTNLATPATLYTIDWGDGAGLDTITGYALTEFHFQASHVFYMDSVQATIRAYAGAVLIETETLPIAPLRSSWWKVDQYRMLRHKGRIGFTEPSRAWLPDWRAFTGDAAEMLYDDFAAVDTWNWIYQLWLRDLDDHGLPDLTLQPSILVPTGTGEGS